MNAVFSAKSVKEMVNVIKDIMMDVNICFENGKMVMSGVDPEHVALVNWTVESETIQSDHLAIGVYMTAIYKFLRNAEKGDDLIMEANDLTGIKLRLKGEKKMIEYFFYNIVLPYQPAISIPKYHHDGHVFIKAAAFQKCLRDISYNSKVLTLWVDHKGIITLSTKGDSGIGTFSFEEEDVVWAYKNFDIFEKCYYLQYFEKFIKSNISESIAIKFDNLLYLAYNKDDEDGTHHELTMGIAPFSGQLS